MKTIIVQVQSNLIGTLEHLLGLELRLSGAIAHSTPALWFQYLQPTPGRLDVSIIIR
jgi:hypothetical protein